MRSKWLLAGMKGALVRSVLAVVVSMAASPGAVHAQEIGSGLFVGGGIDVASVPRAFSKVCGPAETLRGTGPEVRAGFRIDRIAIVARGAFVFRPDETARASPACPAVPDGVHTERRYAATGASALHLDGSIRYRPSRLLPGWLGPEIGYVRDLDSRYWGAVLGVRRGNLTLEGSLRSYSVRYEAITREWQNGQVVRTLDRSSARESLVGAALRLVVETR